MHRKRLRFVLDLLSKIFAKSSKIYFIFQLTKLKRQLLLHQCLASGLHGAPVQQVAEEEAKKELAHAQVESPSVAISSPPRLKIAARKNARPRLAGPTGQLGRNAGQNKQLFELFYAMLIFL